MIVRSGGGTTIPRLADFRIDFGGTVASRRKPTKAVTFDEARNRPIRRRRKTRQSVIASRRKQSNFARETDSLFSSAQGDLEAALDSRPGHYCLIPALDVREVGQIDLMALVAPRPAENGEIGNREIAAGELDLAEPLV